MVEQTSVSQEWIVRIGTGMAFVSKTLLVVSASIIYAQHHWLSTASKSFKIRQIDTMSSILGIVLGFTKSSVWLLFSDTCASGWRHVVFTSTCHLHAVQKLTRCRLLPIAAIITPATMTVVANQDITNLANDPPQLYFDHNEYASLQTQVRRDHVGLSADALRTAYASAVTGQILAISTGFPNIGYTLHFIRPALRCDLPMLL